MATGIVKRHSKGCPSPKGGGRCRCNAGFMGHSKIQTTIDIYGHLLPGSHDDVRERMDAYLMKENDSAAPAVTGAAGDVST